jgi:hypothetical protein
MYGIVKQKGGKFVPDSEFDVFTWHHRLEDMKLDDSVGNLLRFDGKIRYQTKGGCWRSKKARVVKDDGASENNVGRKLFDKLEC